MLFLLYLHVKPTSNFDIFQVPLTLSPVTGRRLDYTLFSVDIGVTNVTKTVVSLRSLQPHVPRCCLFFFHPSTSSKHYYSTPSVRADSSF